MTKFHFIFDKTLKSQILKRKLLKNFKNNLIKNSKVIIIAGGDGFMLNTLKKFAKFNLPFYGINCGTFGFLMNKFSSIDLEKKILKAKKTTINPLEIVSYNKKSKKKIIAINEVSLFRQSRQTASLRLQIAKKRLVKFACLIGLVLRL